MRIDLDIPKGWDELSPKQLMFVVKQFNAKLSRTQFLTFCLLEFAGWEVLKDRSTDCHFKSNGETFSLDKGVFNTLCENLSWLISERGACTNLPKIGVARSCDAELEDVTLDQYLFADAHYQMYNQTKEPKYLAILAATLYRPWWQRFNADRIVKRRYKYFLRRPIHLEAVLLWYAGTKVMLKEKNPALFKSSSDGGSSHFDAESIYRNTLSALNGGRVVDNDKILKVPCTHALKELDVLNAQSDKMKKK